MVQMHAYWIVSLSLFSAVSASLVPVAKLFPSEPYKLGYAIKDKQSGQYRGVETMEETGDHSVRGSFGFVDDRGMRRHVSYVADGGRTVTVKTNETAGVKMDSTTLEASEFEKQFKKEAQESKLSIEHLIEQHMKGKEAKKETEGSEAAMPKLGGFIPGKGSLPLSPISMESRDLLGVGYLSPKEFTLRLLQGRARYGLSKEHLGVDPLSFQPNVQKVTLYKNELKKKERIKGIALSSGSGQNKLSFVPIF